MSREELRRRLRNLATFRYALRYWRQPAIFRATWFECLDHLRGTYDHAHGSWWRAGRGGPDPQPPDIEPCWCPIGKDHDAGRLAR
jgi:hypothetical protein